MSSTKCRSDARCTSNDRMSQKRIDIVLHGVVVEHLIEAEPHLSFPFILTTTDIKITTA